jgi:hypothetical protein
MTKPYDRFVKQVLGDHGYAAVSKAVAQMPELASAVPSQTIISWVETCSRLGYEGEVPGTAHSFAIAKSEDGYSVAIDQDRATFSSVSGVAMALAQYLEFVPQDAPSLSKEQLDQLVKSIDLLTKFNLVKAQGGSAMRSAKPPSAPTPQAMATKPEDPGSGSKRMLSANKAAIPQANKPAQPGKMQVIKPSESKPPSGMDTKSTKVVGASIVKPPKPKGQQTTGAAKKTPKAAGVGKSEAATLCPSCGQGSFSETEFVGCKCFAELAKSTYSKKVDDGFVIFFNYQWDAESISCLLKNLRG